MSSVSMETDTEHLRRHGNRLKFCRKTFCFETKFSAKGHRRASPIFFCFQLRQYYSSLFKMSNLENHNPQVIRQISKEVKNLTTEQLEGIRISVNESNMTDIQATIDGPGENHSTDKLCEWALKRVKDSVFASDIDPIST